MEITFSKVSQCIKKQFSFKDSFLENKLGNRTYSEICLQKFYCSSRYPQGYFKSISVHV